MSIDKITIFKIKQHISSFSDFLREKKPKHVALAVPAGSTYTVEVVTAFKSHESDPKTHDKIPWLVFLNDGLPVAERFTFKSENKFPSAILAVKITENGTSEFYAIVFGLAGESHILPDQVVRDFGIRVAMNICDEDKLKRVQSTRHAEVSTQSERQISAGSSFSVFDIDDEKEFLQVIAGASGTGYEFIQSFTGKESIAIKASKDSSVKWDNLIDRVRALAAAYKLTKFETSFPGYAKFHYETDTAIIDALDAQLFKSISKRNFSTAHLAPPEVVDYATCDFSFGQEESRFEDLTLSDLIDSRKRNFQAKASIDSIKTMRVKLWNVDTNLVTRSWSAYRCIVAEGSYNGDTFILSNGQWKKVSKTLQDEIDAYIPTVATGGCAYLPHDVNIWNAKENKNQEHIFNARAKLASSDLFLLDKGKIKIGGKRIYEVCDLLHKDCELIQVKRFQNSSSSVSHLFLQGRFYGEAFLTDEQTRIGLRTAIENTLGLPSAKPFLDIVPIKRDFHPKDYSIVFCLLTENDIELKDLPFMARYELMHSHRFIRNTLGMNCGVVFRRIKVEDKSKLAPATKP
ncbi:DUF6119 family protein [Duganella sp. HH101]|uniref:DUF6119 family protein n=1 Tax=Duganella sp. HH101 TaxID=1781066 RepID=UPI000892F9A3|nr:DUF6119 family protein [Duganella sp. HH101]OFA00173.1 hypothetical protein DUGA2_50060 [Duganella sp. HH101]